MRTDQPRTLELFFSYSHKDKRLRDKLATQLRALERQQVITAWHDRRITAGAEWARHIDEHLNTADIILLLVSADFIDSNYIWDVELKRAMERHEAGEARVIPVILRPCDWKHPPFAELQALPKDAKPITTWSNQDAAFLDVAEGIRRVAQELSRKQKSKQQDSLKRNTVSPSTGGSSLAAKEKRQGIALDLHHGQYEWDRFLAFAQDSKRQFQLIRRGILNEKQVLDRSAALIVALPYRSLFTQKEVDYIEEWVLAGGGLFLLGNYAPIHHESNPNDLANRFDFQFEDDLVMPGDKSTDPDSRTQARFFNVDWAVKVRPSGSQDHRILQGITEVAFLSSCSIKILANPDGTSENILKCPATCGVMIPKGKRDPPHGFMRHIERWELDQNQKAEIPVLAVCQRGRGRVVVSGSWKICTLNYGDNAKLVKNILEWLSEAAEQ